MRLVSVLLLWGAVCAPAQNLTVDFVMRGPNLYGFEPRAVRWSGDSQRVYFQWKRHSDAYDAEYDTYVANRDGSGLRKLSDDEAKQAPPVGGNETRDRKRVVFAERGDLYLYDRTTGVRRRLTWTTDVESDPRFTADGKRVAFQRASNLYVLSLEDASIDQRTDIRPAGSPPADPRKGTESQEEIKKEERALLEAVERRAKKREEEEAKRKKENPRKPYILAARQTVQRMVLMPDEKYVLATINETAADAKRTIVPNFVTESAYTETIPSRTYVGDVQARTRLLVLNVETGEGKWLDTGLKEKVKEKEKEKEVDRAVTFGPVVLSEEGNRAAAVIRASDNKDAWLAAIDVEGAKARILFQTHDDAWLNFSDPGGAGFLGDNRTLYFRSEKDGWRHLYTVSWDGGEARQLTSGKWEVASAELSRDKKTFWLETSEESLYERHFYAMPVEGGARTKVTSKPGQSDATVSPDGAMLAVVYSYVNKPPELYLMENRPGAELRKVTDSPAPEFWNTAWMDAPIITIPARDGAQVPARIYKPKNWKAGGPAVFFVHGAGYLQNVHRGWATYPREYLYQHILAERGFLVLDLDYRASAGYGRDWRTAVYRHMGGKDLDDYIDAVRWAVKEQGVDPKRIGIYGGSYGGFMTLMAMFTQPDVFAAGAALRPVTDWAHYNHGYTSDILNLPQKDTEAYKRSSPIFHAAGLKGALPAAAR